MAIWSGYIGLAVGFILLMTMLLWIVISTKGSVFLKAVLIPVTLWYGTVLFFSAQNFMGWPAQKAVPEDSYVLAFRIREPDPSDSSAGAIFLWASTPSASGLSEDAASGLSINPKEVFEYRSKGEPRAYRLPYDRELHKMLLKAQENQKNSPGSMIQVRKNGDAGRRPADGQSQAQLELNIVNPLEMLPRKN